MLSTLHTPVRPSGLPRTQIRKFTESKLAISAANAFSGGVFRSLAIGHMLFRAYPAFPILLPASHAGSGVH